MSSIFAVNENNDIYATSANRLAIRRGIDAVLQNCEHVVKTRFTEVYYDRTKGVDYFGLVFTGSPNLPAYEADVRSLIAQVDGVRSITDFTYSLESGILSYQLTIATIYGEGTISGGGSLDGIVI